jgi:type IV pilus assembly protein PilA
MMTELWIHRETIMKLHHAARQRGFTLIELMIVIAIVGILAAIALPAYQDYTVRARMSEPMAKLAEAKTSIAEFVSARGNAPATLAVAGVDVTPALVQTEIIDQITYSQGPPIIIGIQAKASVFPDATAAGFELVGTTQPGTRTIQWTCRPGTLLAAAQAKYLPANCRN